MEGKAGLGTGGLSVKAATTTASLSFILSNAEDADSSVASTDIPGIGSLGDTVNFTITILGKKI